MMALAPYFKVWAVDMRCHYGHASSLLPLLGDSEGQERALVSREVVFTSNLQVLLPVIVFSNLKGLIPLDHLVQSGQER
jgi:hypothetical protein